MRSPIVKKAGGSEYESLANYTCFERCRSNKRFLARIGASSGRRQVEDRASLGSQGSRRGAWHIFLHIEIQNDGDEPDRLLGATIEGAGTGVFYKPAFPR